MDAIDILCHDVLLHVSTQFSTKNKYFLDYYCFSGDKNQTPKNKIVQIHYDTKVYLKNYV